MDNTFNEDEKLYRAVYPPSYTNMYWKKDGSLSSAAFSDKNGLSVERGNYRTSDEVIKMMKKTFTGCIVSVTVGNCNETNAVVQYCPSKRSKYHSEIHGSHTKIILNKSQMRYLAQKAVKEYMEP